MKTKILFVDDEPNILQGFRVVLHSKRKVWKARFVESGDAALAMMEQEPFDIVIADMRMPGMDGATLLTEVRRRYPGVIRIILSGYSEMEPIMRSVKPAHQFLAKPCGAERLIGTIERVERLRDVLTDEAVSQGVSRLGSLPALPDLFLQIQQELMSPDPSLAKIGRLVERDVGISATLLKIANSSFFGVFNKVNSPAHAVTLLGVEVTKGLVLGAKLIQQFDASLYSNYSLEKLWEHSRQTAAFAKALARAEGLGDDVAADCYTGGLLHDVGKFVFATTHPAEYRKVLGAVQAGEGVVRDMEQRQLGVTHDRVGAYLLGLWGLSEIAVEAVRAHHEPRLAGPGITPGLLVHVANSLQHELVIIREDYTFTKLDEEYMHELGLMNKLVTWRDICLEQLLTGADHEG